jgi:tRNA threonylcarbamoyladenosine biosynthesis protein TsaB
MKLLAIEFSTERRSVSVADDGRILATKFVEDRRAGTIGLIESVLDEAAMVREDVEGLVIGLGPGSYTGIRSAIAIAQGWQLGRDIRLCSVSSVDVLAGSADLPGEIVVAVDAQRGEFYCATYERLGATVSPTSDLRIVTRDDLLGLAGADRPIVGPGAGELGPMGIEAYPDAAVLVKQATLPEVSVDGAELAPIYLRPVEFRKAPPARIID